MYKVQKNHGSAGVDHMPVTKLSELLSIDKGELTARVRSGKYLPQAILGVEIPKGKGKTWFAWELNRGKLMHGAAREWEDGVLPKAQFLELRLQLNAWNYVVTFGQPFFIYWKSFY